MGWNLNAIKQAMDFQIWDLGLLLYQLPFFFNGRTRLPLQVPSQKWRTCCLAFSKGSTPRPSSSSVSPQGYSACPEQGRLCSCCTVLPILLNHPTSELSLCRLWHWSQQAKSLGTYHFFELQRELSTDIDSSGIVICSWGTLPEHTEQSHITTICGQRGLESTKYRALCSAF